MVRQENAVRQTFGSNLLELLQPTVKDIHPTG